MRNHETKALKYTNIEDLSILLRNLHLQGIFTLFLFQFGNLGAVGYF